MRSCLLDSAQPLPEEIGPAEGQTARYWPDADAQAGGVSDMSRKVGTEWGSATDYSAQVLEFLGVTGLNNRWHRNAAISMTSYADSRCANTSRGADFGTILAGRSSGKHACQPSGGPTPQSSPRARALGPPHCGDF
jgi:hypothetical protein